MGCRLDFCVARGRRVSFFRAVSVARQIVDASLFSSTTAHVPPNRLAGDLSGSDAGLPREARREPAEAGSDAGTGGREAAGAASRAPVLSAGAAGDAGHRLARVPRPQSPS